MEKFFQLVFILSLPLVIAGCIFQGDRPYVTRTVSVSFPSSQGQNNGPDVTNAVQRIDSVMRANGFARESRPDMATNAGFIASYVRYDNPGVRLGVIPDVYFRDGHLDVIITEMGNRTGHVSAITKQICESLRRDLSALYGSKRVKIRS